jgi:hypothetical protein
MRSIVSALLLGILAHACFCATAPALEPPPFWGKLSPGPYAVGFRSVWQLDYSRTYQMVFDDKTSYAAGKAPRPILVNIWYPALEPDEPVPMAHGDYLAIETGDVRLAKFATKLAAYNRAVVCKEVMYKTAAELTERQRQVLDQFWKTPTASFRNATPVDSRFPLVIYHSGFGSSFEDNAVLCEFLASHGFVVIGSAFQDSSGETFNVGGAEKSARDMGYLIAYARRFSYVDWNHVGVVGHSGGAQFALIARSSEASPLDAVVSLDTTQDYYSLADRRWDYLKDPVIKNAENMAVPILMVANAHAFFELADRLKGSERQYLTVSGLDHNDFISQGIIHHELECRLEPGKPELRTQLQRARSSYEAICACVLDFFEGCFKRNWHEKSALAKQLEQNPENGRAPHLELVPRGATGPEPFRDDLNLPPTPRQFRPLLAKRGLESTLTLLERYHARAPHAAIFEGNFGFALIDELLEKGQTHDAIAFQRLYGKFGLNVVKDLLALGDMYRGRKETERARAIYQKARALEPDNAEVAKRLKELPKPAHD